MAFLAIVLKKFWYASIFLSVTYNSKESWSREKFNNSRLLQENLARSAANQSTRTIVAIY